jgi:hypothetical protein
VGVAVGESVTFAMGHVSAVKISQPWRVPRLKLETIKTPLHFPFPFPKLFKFSSNEALPSKTTAALCNDDDVATLLIKHESIKETIPDCRP